MVGKLRAEKCLHSRGKSRVWIVGEKWNIWQLVSEEFSLLYGLPKSHFLPVPDILYNIIYCVPGMALLFQLVLHLAQGVYHCRVVPASKGLANFYHGHLGDFPHHMHGHLSCFGHRGITLL